MLGLKSRYAVSSLAVQGGIDDPSLLACKGRPGVRMKGLVRTKEAIVRQIGSAAINDARFSCQGIGKRVHFPQISPPPFRGFSNAARGRRVFFLRDLHFSSHAIRRIKI